MDAVIGTAGWSIGRAEAAAFPPVGTALERYSRVFNGVEINSSFYRPHRASTWARWAESVPERFRFAVKIPKTITHQAQLVDTGELTAQFAEQVAPLGSKLAVLLVQLPPRLVFDAGVVEQFFITLHQSIKAEIACEPRNETWFLQEADTLLRELRVVRVAADPAHGATAAIPGGWRGIAYWRLHGSPVVYRSRYSDEAIATYAQRIREARDQAIDTWCIFDNTAASAAMGNALSLMARLSVEPSAVCAQTTS